MHRSCASLVHRRSVRPAIQRPRDALAASPAAHAATRVDRRHAARGAVPIVRGADRTAAATDRPTAALRRAPIAGRARCPSERMDFRHPAGRRPVVGHGAGEFAAAAVITLSGGIGLAKEELLELDGIVDEVLPDSKYRVTLENGVVVGAYASGRMRKNHIRILAGDRVTLELSVYDLTKGRINFRHKDANSPRPPRSGQPRR